jgi:hypothetical protein
MPDNLPPSPAGTEPGSNNPASQQPAGNESVGRGDQSSGDSTATPKKVDFASLSKEQLIQIAAEQNSKIADLGQGYGASKKYGEAAAQRLKEQDQMLTQVQLRNQALQDQIAAQALSPAPAAPATPNPYGNVPTQGPQAPVAPGIPHPDPAAMSPVNAMVDSLAEGDTEKFGQALNQYGQHLKQEWNQEANQFLAQNARQTAAMQDLQEGAQEILGDSNLTQLAMKKYVALSQNQRVQLLAQGAPSIDIGVGEKLNSNILRRAIDETKLEAARQTADPASAAADSFVEPNSAVGPAGSSQFGGPPEGDGVGRLDPENNEAHALALMNEDEKAYLQSSGGTPTGYFKWMNPQLRDARIAQRRYIKSTELGLRVV